MGTNNIFKYQIFSGIVFVTVVIIISILYSCKKLEIERITKVATGEVTDITAHSATITGSIMDIGEAGITQYGHCWDIKENPVAELTTKTNLGKSNALVNYNSKIDGLQSGTQYFVRAYVVSDDRISYGKNISFYTILVTLPEVTTDVPHNIGTNSATCGGNVISDGGAEIFERGICWNINPNPDIYDNKISSAADVGEFFCDFEGLLRNTGYYCRAYATNEMGTSYGDERAFKTFGVMDFDGNGYYSVIIGEQEWMQQNLKTTHYSDGTSLINGANAGNITNDYATKYFFVNNNDEEVVSEYGRLYTWAAVMNGSNSSGANPSGIQGVCPTGWHVPSDTEWMELEIHLGMSASEAEKKFDRGTNEGGKLKSTEYFWPPNTGATNESRFSAMPGGDRGPEDTFNLIGGFGVYWSTTESFSDAAYIRGLDYNKATVNRWDHLKHFGFSVRCLKDR